MKHDYFKSRWMGTDRSSKAEWTYIQTGAERIRLQRELNSMVSRLVEYHIISARQYGKTALTAWYLWLWDRMQMTTVQIMACPEGAD